MSENSHYFREGFRFEAAVIAVAGLIGLSIYIVSAGLVFWFYPTVIVGVFAFFAFELEVYDPELEGKLMEVEVEISGYERLSAAIADFTKASEFTKESEGTLSRYLAGVVRPDAFTNEYEDLWPKSSEVKEAKSKGFTTRTVPIPETSDTKKAD